MSKSYDVFISYSSEDRPLAEALCRHLEQGNLRCWIAPRDVTQGKNYTLCIMEGIRESHVMVLVLSEHSNRSGQVLKEIEQAGKHNLRLLPFCIADFEFSPEMDFYISPIHWLDAKPGSAESYFDTLEHNVRKIIGGPIPPSPSPPPPPPPPPPPLPPTQPPYIKLQGEDAFLQQVMNSLNENQKKYFYMTYSGKRKSEQDIMIYSLIGMFILPGLQRFMLGQVAMGLVYLFTWGFCFIGSLIDVVNYKSLTEEYNKKMAYECFQVAKMSS